MNNVLALKNTDIDIDDIKIVGYLNLETISKDQLMVNNKKQLLIIPNDKEIKNKLKEKQFVEFEDFVIKNYYDKKIAILYGNCHMESLSECLNKHKAFTERYVIYPIMPIYMVKDESYFDDPIFKHCDLFIHQSIRKNNRYGGKFASENIIQSLKPECKVIAVPNLYHLPMCYFPQYTEEQELKHRIGQTVFFRDKIIDEQYKRGISAKKIGKMYYSTDCGITKEEVENLWRVFLAKVEQREADWDIKILDFIKRNKKEMLFFDPNHPRPILIKYIAKELCNTLNIITDGIDNMNINLLDTYEMPICKSVIDYFDMNLSLMDVELRVSGLKIINKKINISEYVNQYTSYIWQEKKMPQIIKLKSFSKHILYFVYRNFLKLIRR